MALVKFTYQIFDNEELPCAEQIVVDTEGAETTIYAPKPRVLNNGTTVPVSGIKVKGHLYQSYTDTLDPNGECCPIDATQIDFSDVPPVDPTKDNNPGKVFIYTDDGLQYMTLKEMQELKFTTNAYVDKQYTGAANLEVKGLLPGDIVSANASYNTQLANAKIGSLQNPYPDPYSARNALLSSIAGGAIKVGRIVVLEDNRWTVGSNDPTKNGMNVSPYTPNSNVVAEIQFTQANGENSTNASMMQHGIVSTWGAGSGFDYINSKYTIFLVYENTPAGRPFISGIVGKGNFKQVYGDPQAFQANYCYIINPLAEVSFQFLEIKQHQQGGWNFDSFQNVSIEIDTYWVYNAGYNNVGQSFAAVVGAPRASYRFYAKHMMRLETGIPGMANTNGQYGANFLINTSRTPTDYFIEIENFYSKDRGGDSNGVFGVNSGNTINNVGGFFVNNNVDIVIHNWWAEIITAGEHVSTLFAFNLVAYKGSGSQTDPNSFNDCSNNRINVLIENLTSDNPIVGNAGFASQGTGNQYSIEVKNCLIRRNKPVYQFVYGGSIAQFKARVHLNGNHITAGGNLITSTSNSDFNTYILEGSWRNTGVASGNAINLATLNPNVILKNIIISCTNAACINTPATGKILALNASSNAPASANVTVAGTLSVLPEVLTFL